MGFPSIFGGSDAYWQEPDFVLSYIVAALVNGIGLEIGVTLMTRGLTISGTLISEAKYLDGITERLQAQVSPADQYVPETAIDALHDLLDLRNMTEFDPVQYKTPPQVSEDESDTVPSEADEPLFDMLDDLGAPLQHLHLIDLVVLTGEPPMSFGEGSGVMLRLRLTSIDGWILGRILPDVPDLSDFDGGLTY
ncbi:MAG: hypothetical protein AAF125_10735 [Chloroflexota bacterium]